MLSCTLPRRYLIALLAYFVISLIVLEEILFSLGTSGFFYGWFIGPWSVPVVVCTRQNQNQDWKQEKQCIRY